MASSSSRSPTSDAGTLEKERAQYRRNLVQAAEEDDPLVPYEQYAKWLSEHEESLPDGLFEMLEILEEVLRTYVDDPEFKKNLKYLKLWIMYAKHVEDPTVVYTYLVKQDIGTTFSPLYEEFANHLERIGKADHAKNVYRLGISKCTRAVERLKARYQEFQARVSSGSALPDSSKKTNMSNAESSQAKGAKFYRNPLRYIKAKKKPSELKAEKPRTSRPFENSDPYAYIKQALDVAPAANKERYMFDMSLLFKDGKEFCIQEARASHLGLLNKKWGPPPPQAPAQGQRSRLVPPVVAEPTVTINTKEALKDVFGMYNSPEKTTTTLLRSGALGTKYAPVKEVEPFNVIQPRNLMRTFSAANSDENAQKPVKPSVFQPFVDEDNKKENATPAPKFKPFVDENANSKTPVVTPGPRKGLALKESSAQLVTKTPVFKVHQDATEDVEEGENTGSSRDKQPESVFGGVFTPIAVAEKAPTRRSEDSQGKPAVFRDITSGESTSNQPKGNGLGLGVFSRPPETLPAKPPQPKATFSIARDNSSSPSDNSREHREPVFHRSFSSQRTPFTPVSRDRQPLGSRESVFRPQQSSQTEEDEPEDGYQDEDEEEYYEEEAYQAPMGGRFGKFDVMTPIAERTCEYTTSTRVFSTPSDGTGPLLDKGLVYHDADAVAAAERLAEELQNDEHDTLQDEVQDEGMDEADEEGAEPLTEDELVERTGTLSLVDAISVASSFRPTNPCNPSDPQILSVLLSLIPQEPDFHDLRTETSGQLNGLQRFASKLRRESGSHGAEYELDLAGRRFAAVDKLGEGGFGAVFLAREIRDLDDDDDDDDDDDVVQCALKVVKPRNIWEYHILRRIHSVVPPELRRSIIIPQALYAYRDESYLVLDYCDQGTLLDLVNKAADVGVKQQGACLNELLVMFFAIELIKFVEGMHSAGFIHGDLKIDNCLLRLDKILGGSAGWSEIYQPNGDGGWKYRGIKVIDFGRTIDTRMFPPDQQYIADWHTDVGDCLEMREKQPWTFQPDYFGLAGIIYCMLFGKYFDSETVALVPSSEPARYRISTPLKRYWQADLWTRLFDLLLNPCLVRQDGALPVIPELKAVRLEMEEWLCNNCTRSNFTLRGLLKKLGRSLI